MPLTAKIDGLANGFAVVNETVNGVQRRTAPSPAFQLPSKIAPLPPGCDAEAIARIERWNHEASDTCGRVQSFATRRAQLLHLAIGGSVNPRDIRGEFERCKGEIVSCCLTALTLLDQRPDVIRARRAAAAKRIGELEAVQAARKEAASARLKKAGLASHLVGDVLQDDPEYTEAGREGAVLTPITRGLSDWATEGNATEPSHEQCRNGLLALICQEAAK